MNVVICIKMIPAKLVFTDATNTCSVNPFDQFALEQIVQWKKAKTIHIIAVLMGVPDNRIAAELKQTGCDEVIFLYDSQFAGADTLATSYVLSKALLKIKDFDMVVCGDHALDGETGHVGFALAERLGIPVVSDITVGYWNEEELYCLTENGCVNQTYQILSPAVLIFRNFIIKKSILSLMQIKRLGQQFYLVWNHEDLETDPGKCGSIGSKTRVLTSHSQMQKNMKQVIMNQKEDINVKAKAIIDILEENYG